MDDILFRRLKAETTKLFKRFGKPVEVFLRATKSKGADYDPIRDEGYSITSQNSVILKAWVRNPSPEGKLLQQIGTIPQGVKEIIVFKKDLTVLKVADRIKIGNEFYHIYDDAAGNRFTKLERIYDMVRILIYRKDGDQ